MLGAEDQTCNEGRHAAHESRCFGLPHPVSAVLSCVRSGCIAAPRSDAAAAAFMRQFQRPISVGGPARSLGPPCPCRRCRCHRGRYCGCAVWRMCRALQLWGQPLATAICRARLARAARPSEPAINASRCTRPAAPTSGPQRTLRALYPNAVWKRRSFHGRLKRRSFRGGTAERGGGGA